MSKKVFECFIMKKSDFEDLTKEELVAMAVAIIAEEIKTSFDKIRVLSFTEVE